MTHHNTTSTVRFGDIAREVTVSTRTPLEDGFDRYIGLEHLDPESLKVRRWGLIEENKTTFTRVFRAGQVLFGRRRAYQRKAALAEFDGICSGDIIVMEAKPDRFLPELLPFIVQTEGFYDHALKTSAGSLSPRTKWSALARYEFPLPPLDEQRRIAEILWAVEEAVEAFLYVDESINILSTCYLSTILYNPRYSTTTVGTLAKFSSGKAIKASALPDQPTTTKTIPVYGGNGISGYTDKDLPGLRDLLVVVGRVGQQCGVTRVVSSPCWITDNALYSVFVDPKIDTQFLGIMLVAAKINHRKIGNYLPLVNQKVLDSTRIPLPDISEQKRILGLYKKIVTSLNTSERHIEKYRRIRRHLVNQLLNPKI